MIRRPPRSTLFPYRRSSDLRGCKAFPVDFGSRYTTVVGPEMYTDRANDIVRGVGEDDLCFYLVNPPGLRSEEHTSELQSPCNLVCRLLLEKKKNTNYIIDAI